MAGLQDLFKNTTHQRAAEFGNTGSYNPQPLDSCQTAQLDALETLLTKLTSEDYEFGLELDNSNLQIAISIYDIHGNTGVFVPFELDRPHPDEGRVRINCVGRTPVSFDLLSEQEHENFVQTLAGVYQALIHHQNKSLGTVQYLENKTPAQDFSAPRL